MEEYIKISTEDIKIGFEAISDIDDRIIPNLVDATGKKAKTDTAQRRVLIAIKLLSLFNGDAEPNGNWISLEINYEEIVCVVRALEVVDEHWDGFIALGGIVSAIRNGQIKDIINHINEHE